MAVIPDIDPVHPKRVQVAQAGYYSGTIPQLIVGTNNDDANAYGIGAEGGSLWLFSDAGSFGFRATGDATNKLRILSDGRLEVASHILMASPTGILNFLDPSRAPVSDSSAGWRIRLHYSTYTGFGNDLDKIWYASPSKHSFYQRSGVDQYTLRMELDSTGKLTVTGDLAVNGTTVSAPNAAVTALSFSGNGASLTNVNAAQLGGQTPSYYLDTSATAQSKIGNLTINGTLTAGSLSGNGASITNVNAAQLGGQTPSYYLDTSATAQTKVGNLTVNGTLTAGSLSGNGAALTNLTPGNVSAGTAGIDISGQAARAGELRSGSTSGTATHFGGTGSTDGGYVNAYGYAHSANPGVVEVSIKQPQDPTKQAKFQIVHSPSAGGAQTLLTIDKDGNATLTGNLTAANSITEYDSGWFAISPLQIVQLTHNLGKLPKHVTVWCGQSTTPTSPSIAGPFVVNTSGVDERGAYVASCTTTTLLVRAGNYIGINEANTGWLTSGYYRVIVWA